MRCRVGRRGRGGESRNRDTRRFGGQVGGRTPPRGRCFHNRELECVRNSQPGLPTGPSQRLDAPSFESQSKVAGSYEAKGELLCCYLERRAAWASGAYGGGAQPSQRGLPSSSIPRSRSPAPSAAIPPRPEVVFDGGSCVALLGHTAAADMHVCISAHDRAEEEQAANVLATVTVAG